MGLEQIWLLEKLIKRFKMKPIKTFLEVGFLLIIFTAACFFGVGLLAEKGRQAASDINFIRTALAALGAIGICSLFIIGFISVRDFLFPKYIWDEKLKVFRNPKTNEIICTKCLDEYKSAISLEKDTTGLFKRCPKCKTMQELSSEEQKKSLSEDILTIVPRKERKKKTIRVSILNRSKKL